MAIALQIAQSLAAIPAELATVVLAAIPIAELRGALPIALTVYNMPVFKAAFLAILGNMLPVWFLLVFFEKLSAWLEAHSPFAHKILEALYERTRRKLEAKVQKYGTWALALFVAVPLPVTGAWTGSLAAHVFGLPKKQAFVSILVGVCIAAVIVTLLTQGALASIRTFL